MSIDPRTDKVTRRVPIGPAPNQLAVTPDGKFAYVPVSDGHYEVVDLAKGKVIERIFTGGRPHNTLCSTDGKRMYLAPMGAPKKVTIVDTATHKPVGEIPFSNVVRPVALTQDEKRLFANVDGLVGVEQADVASRKMIHRVPADLADEHKKKASRSHGICRPARPEGTLGMRRGAFRGPRLRHHQRQAEADCDRADRQPGLLADVLAGRQDLLCRRPRQRRGGGRRYGHEENRGPHPGRQGTEATARRHAEMIYHKGTKTAKKAKRRGSRHVISLRLCLFCGILFVFFVPLW